MWSFRGEACTHMKMAAMDMLQIRETTCCAVGVPYAASANIAAMRHDVRVVAPMPSTDNIWTVTLKRMSGMAETSCSFLREQDSSNEQPLVPVGSELRNVCSPMPRARTISALRAHYAIYLAKIGERCA